MGFFRDSAKRIQSAFTYEALTPNGRRKSVSSQIHREDYHTRGNRGRALQANASDLVRNMSVIAWAVRQHLNYCSAFSFNSQTANTDLNDQIERLMKEDSTRERCDIAGRHDREKLFRTIEARRVVDGDCGLIMLDSGHLQGIQHDLIRNPTKSNPGEEWINGVQVSETGRHLKYCVHSRQGYSGRTNERLVAEKNVLHYGFFTDRFAADCVRGVSPLTAALDPLRDLKESVALAQARAKVAQIFAMAITRESEEGFGEDDGTEYSVDFNHPQILDMAPNDKAEFLESKTPSTEFQAFTKLVIMLSLKAIDIPYTLFDSKGSTFYGGRAEWLNYIHSCQEKRADQVAARNEYTIWRIRHWIRDGRLTLPYGMRVGDIDFAWIPKNSTPWWDKSKETRGDLAAIRGGLDSPQRIAAEKGFIFTDIIDAIAEAQEYAKSKGVQVDFAPEATSTKKEEA